MSEFKIFNFEEEYAKEMGMSVQDVGTMAIDWDKYKAMMKRFGQWLIRQTKDLMVWVGEILHEHRAEIMVALKDVALATIREATENPDWDTMTSTQRRDLVYDLLTAKMKQAGIEVGGHIFSEEIGIPPELEDDIRLVIELAMAMFRDEG